MPPPTPLSSRIPDAVPDAPVIRATLSDMDDFVELIAKTGPLLDRFGAVRIEPPAEWIHPPLRMNPASRFFVKSQRLPEAPFVDLTPLPDFDDDNDHNDEDTHHEHQHLDQPVHDRKRKKMPVEPRPQRNGNTDNHHRDHDEDEDDEDDADEVVEVASRMRARKPPRPNARRRRVVSYAETDDEDENTHHKHSSSSRTHDVIDLVNDHTPQDPDVVEVLPTTQTPSQPPPQQPQPAPTPPSTTPDEGKQPVTVTAPPSSKPPAPPLLRSVLPTLPSDTNVRHNAWPRVPRSKPHPSPSVPPSSEQQAQLHHKNVNEGRAPASVAAFIYTSRPPPPIPHANQPADCLTHTSTAQNQDKPTVQQHAANDARTMSPSNASETAPPVSTAAPPKELVSGVPGSVATSGPVPMPSQPLTAQRALAADKVMHNIAPTLRPPSLMRPTIPTHGVTQQPQPAARPPVSASQSPKQASPPRRDPSVQSGLQVAITQRPATPSITSVIHPQIPPPAPSVSPSHRPSFNRPPEEMSGPPQGPLSQQQREWLKAKHGIVVGQTPITAPSAAANTHTAKSPTGPQSAWVPSYGEGPPVPRTPVVQHAAPVLQPPHAPQGHGRQTSPHPPAPSPSLQPPISAVESANTTAQPLGEDSGNTEKREDGAGKALSRPRLNRNSLSAILNHEPASSASCGFAPSAPPLEKDAAEVQKLEVPRDDCFVPPSVTAGGSENKRDAHDTPADSRAHRPGPPLPAPAVPVETVRTASVLENKSDVCEASTDTQKPAAKDVTIRLEPAVAGDVMHPPFGQEIKPDAHEKLADGRKPGSEEVTTLSELAVPDVVSQPASHVDNRSDAHEKCADTKKAASREVMGLPSTEVLDDAVQPSSGQERKPDVYESRADTKKTASEEGKALAMPAVPNGVVQPSSGQENEPTAHETPAEAQKPSSNEITVLAAPAMSDGAAQSSAQDSKGAGTSAPAPLTMADVLAAARESTQHASEELRQFEEVGSVRPKLTAGDGTAESKACEQSDSIVPMEVVLEKSKQPEPHAENRMEVCSAPGPIGAARDEPPISVQEIAGETPKLESKTPGQKDDKVQMAEEAVKHLEVTVATAAEKCDLGSNSNDENKRKSDTLPLVSREPEQNTTEQLTPGLGNKEEAHTTNNTEKGNELSARRGEPAQADAVCRPELLRPAGPTLKRPRPTKRVKKNKRGVVSFGKWAQDESGRLLEYPTFQDSVHPVSLQAYERMAMGFGERMAKTLAQDSRVNQDVTDIITQHADEDWTRNPDVLEGFFWEILHKGVNGRQISVNYGVDVEAEGAYQGESYVEWYGMNRAGRMVKQAKPSVPGGGADTETKSEAHVEESVAKPGKVAGEQVHDNDAVEVSNKKKRKRAIRPAPQPGPKCHVGILNRKGLLRHVPRMPGVNHSMFYVGHMFTRFCWHTEDAFLNSVSYLHHGSADKIWYAIPPKFAEAFEEYAAEEVFNDRLAKDQPGAQISLMSKTTMFDPRKLKSRGIECYRIRHQPGSFVVTAPRAYHAGFNCGFNIAEAVNFANPSWFPVGRTASQCARRGAYTLIVPYEYLLFHEAKALRSAFPGSKGEPKVSPRVVSNARILAVELDAIIEEGEHRLREYATTSNCRIAMLSEVDGLVKNNQLGPEFGPGAGMVCSICKHACHFYAEICGSCPDNREARCVAHFGKEFGPKCRKSAHKPVLVRRHDPVLLADLLNGLEEMAGIKPSPDKVLNRYRGFMRTWETPVKSSGLRLRLNLKLAASRTPPVVQKEKPKRNVRRSEQSRKRELKDDPDFEHVKKRRKLDTRKTDVQRRRGSFEKGRKSVAVRRKDTSRRQKQDRKSESVVVPYEVLPLQPEVATQSELVRATEPCAVSTPLHYDPSVAIIAGNRKRVGNEDGYLDIPQKQ